MSKINRYVYLPCYKSTFTPSYVGLRWPEHRPKWLPSASIILPNSHGEIFATLLKVKAYLKSIIKVIQT